MILVDQELQQRLEDLAALHRHNHADGRSKSLELREESSAVKMTETGDETTIPDSDEKAASGSFEDVRTEFVLQSVGLLVKLEEDLMALVRDRGKDYGNTCRYGFYVSSSPDCRYECAKYQSINGNLYVGSNIRDQ